MSTQTIDAVLTAVRNAPLSTLDDVKSLLAVCVSRIQDFDRATLGCDLSAVIDELSDAEHCLEVAMESSVDPVEALRWMEEARRAA